MVTMLQYGMVQYGMVQYGIVQAMVWWKQWYGVVQCNGMV